MQYCGERSERGEGCNEEACAGKKRAGKGCHAKIVHERSSMDTRVVSQWLTRLALTGKTPRRALDKIRALSDGKRELVRRRSYAQRESESERET